MNPEQEKFWRKLGVDPRFVDSKKGRGCKIGSTQSCCNRALYQEMYTWVAKQFGVAIAHKLAKDFKWKVSGRKK